MAIKRKRKSHKITARRRQRKQLKITNNDIIEVISRLTSRVEHIACRVDDIARAIHNNTHTIITRINELGQKPEGKTTPMPEEGIPENKSAA